MMNFFHFSALFFSAIPIMDVGFSVIDLQSISVVPCTNKAICQNGKNLKIIFRASAIETASGIGNISGIITAGHAWNDSFGNWTLSESIEIDINYRNAVWEYRLNEVGQFFTLSEFQCGGAFPSCTFQTNYVECANRNQSGIPGGLYLVDSMPCTKYSIETVETWTADVFVRSSESNVGSPWTATDAQSSTEQNDIEMSIVAKFDESACYRDLSNYYVVVQSFGSQNYYFTSKQYWNDARNNFNISVAAWKRDFDCDYQWQGWHTIIPFYETDAEYFASGMVRTIMINNQLAPWSNQFIESYFYSVMNMINGECTDNTVYTDSFLTAVGPPENNIYVIGKEQIAQYFVIILELNYMQFLRYPTTAPTLNPSVNPTISPTTSSPTTEPIDPPTTKNPTNTPITSAPTPHPPSISPTNVPLFYYNTLTTFDANAHLEITTSQTLDFSRAQRSLVQKAIAEAMGVFPNAVLLLTGEEWEVYADASTKRRLTSTEYVQSFEFVVHALTKEEQTRNTAVITDTSTLVLMEQRFEEVVPHYMKLFFNHFPDNCPEGYEQKSFAGEPRCYPICKYNEKYDHENHECILDDRSNLTRHRIIYQQRDNWPARLLFIAEGFIIYLLIAVVTYVVYRWNQGRKIGLQQRKEKNEKHKIEVASNKYKLPFNIKTTKPNRAHQNIIEEEEENDDENHKRIETIVSNVRRLKNRLGNNNRSLDDDSQSDCDGSSDSESFSEEASKNLSYSGSISSTTDSDSSNLS
jgi:hypothetical protein